MTTPLAAKSSLIGSVLLGRYRVVRELAKGGMGVVYLARSEGAVGFVKPVVIKLVLPEHADDRRFLGMFAREAQILAHLRHPSIVAVQEFGEQDGAYVMVLEYVRGYHLGQWMRYLRMKGRSLPADIAIQLTIDVLDALHHAHSMVHPDGTSMQIVHRDVSPSNILLDEDGRPRLLDFGVARMRGGDVNYQTQVKGFVGKLMYSAPEVFTEGDSNPSSDCYSCAVVLHEMLLGRNTFRSDNQAKTLHNVLNHTPEPVERARNDVPTGLDAVLYRALAKTPAERYASARDFAAALRTVQQDSESEVRGRLATLVKQDFNREMAELLGLESLADRDTAWRRLNFLPSTSEEIEIDDTDELDSVDRSSSAGGRTSRAKPTPSVPPPTVMGRSHPANSQHIPPPPPPTPNNESLAPVATVVAVPAARPLLASHIKTYEGPNPILSAQRLQLVWPGVAVAALAVAAWAYSAGPRQSPAPKPQIQVVQSPREPSVTVEPAPRPEAPANPGTPEPPAKGVRPVRTARAAPRAPAPDAQELTRAFRKQQVPIADCFEQHAVALQGVPVLTLEFDLEADGKLASVRVVPSNVAVTPLGQCIKKVASATRFPPQGKSVSFAIPLSASKTSGT